MSITKLLEFTSPRYQIFFYVKKNMEFLKILRFLKTEPTSKLVFYSIYYLGGCENLLTVKSCGRRRLLQNSRLFRLEVMTKPGGF